MQISLILCITPRASGAVVLKLALFTLTSLCRCSECSFLQWAHFYLLEALLSFFTLGPGSECALCPVVWEWLCTAIAKLALWSHGIFMYSEFSFLGFHGFDI